MESLTINKVKNMEYIGKLYGKIGKGYLPLLETSEDVENLKKRITLLEKLLKENKILPPTNLHIEENKEQQFDLKDFEKKIFKDPNTPRQEQPLIVSEEYKEHLEKLIENKNTVANLNIYNAERFYLDELE